MSLKIKVKAEGNDAKKVVEAIHAHLPSKAEVKANRIPNYVSDDALHIPVGANSGKQKGSERVLASARDPRPGEVLSSCTEAEYRANAFPPVNSDQVAAALEATTVKPTRVGGNYEKLPIGHPERIRQLNNRARDMRTNLGRGKQSIVEVE